MKFNKKYCLLFLMTVLVLLLGAGMVSASEAGSDVQVVKDNQGLSTPDNYDVDNVVQSDRVLTKSEANVEKTSTKDDTNNNESSIDTFVDTDNTNEDLQTIASGSGHSAKVSVNEISGRTLNIAGLENSDLLQETIDVNKISINSYDSLASSEDMTPILTGETTDSSNGLVDTNTKSNVKSQETDKTIAKVQSDRSTKTADDSSFELPYEFTTEDGLKLVIGENAIVSEDTYQAIGVWSDWYGAYYETPENPFLMNDTTWTYCLDGDEADPSGNGGYPPYYRRITLTGNEQLINRYTQTDILPYLRTFVYYYWNATDIFSTQSTGKVTFNRVIYTFTEGNYTDRHSEHYNNWRIGNEGKLVWDYVNEVMDIVDSGNGINNTGVFNGSDFLTYQFYLYVVDRDLTRHYSQPLLGFNILTKIDVTKEWDDGNNFENKRPDNITINLYGNDLYIQNVTLNRLNNWNHTFTELPVYYAYNLSSPLTSNDYSYDTLYEDCYNITLRKDMSEYTGSLPTRIYIYIYDNNGTDNKYLGSTTLYRSSNYQTTLEYMTKYREDGSLFNYTFKASNSLYEPYPLIETKSDDYQVKHFNYTITNESFKTEEAYIEIFKNGEFEDLGFISDENGWSLLLLNLPIEASADDYSLVYRYNQPRINVVNYTVGEVIVSDEYTSTITETRELTNPLMPTEDEVESCPIPGYPYIDEDINDILTTVTITNTQLIEINVTKVWNDSDNQDGIRPNNITVALYKGDELYDNVTLSDENDWKHTFSNLIMYENGDLINYRVEEVKKNGDNFIRYVPEGYTLEINEVSDYNFTFTNTHIPEKTSIVVNKVWDDADDKDGLRPEVINLRFLVNGVYNETISLEELNNWTKSYYDLPKYSEGSLVNYTFEEINVPEGYNVSYSSLARDPTKIDTVIHCESIGTEDNPIYRFHVTNLTNDLIYGGELDIYNSSGSLIDLSGLYESDGGYFDLTWPSDKEFNVRAIYRDNRDYMECDMWFDESNIGDMEIDTFRPDYNITVRNTHVPKTINFTVTKVWNDTDDRDGFRPDSITVKLLVNGEESEDYVTILNQENNWTYTFENLPEIVDGKKVEYTVGEIGCPEYNVSYGPVIIVSEDKKQQVNIAFELTDLNDAESSTPDNPKYVGTFNVLVKDETDEFVTEGNIVIYDSTGNEIARGSLENGILVIDLPVTLSEEGVYPINLPTFPEIIFNYTIVYEENQYYLGNDATYTFEDINNFWISKSLRDSPWQLTDGSWTFCISADKAGTPTHYGMNYLPIYSDFNMTNIITKEDMTPYILTFLYNHMYDTENFTASPYNPNIAGEHIQRIINVFLGYYGKNYRNFDHSDLYNRNTKSGHDLTYFIEETIRQVEYGQAVQRHGIRNVTDDGVWKYDFYEYKPYAEYFGNTQWQHIIALNFTFVPNVIEMETTITNTHISENVTINVTKVWNDSDNQDGIRPDNITVALFKGDELYDKVILSEDNDWKHTFTDLPKYENGELIDYEVDEGVYEFILRGRDPNFRSEVPVGYTLEIDEVSEYNFTLTNTHVPLTTNITVVKNWTDDNDKVNIRPDHIVLQLYANGTPSGEPVVMYPDEGGNWKYDFTDLAVYSNGVKINYTVVEDVPRNYTETYNFTVNITVSHEPMEEQVIPLPSDDMLLLSEEDPVVINLLANGKTVDSTFTVDVQDIFCNKWNHTYVDLPVYDDDGELISYTFIWTKDDETYDPVLYVDYNMTCSYAVNIDNRITGNTTINVTKVWNDTNNNDGKRPDSVNITLVIDGVPSDQTVELKGPNYEGGFNNLPMYHENGTAIVYNVTEVERDVPEGYELSDIVFCEGRFKVINTYIPENVTVNVTKVWDDVEDNDRVRPANVTVILLQNGEEYRAVVLNATGGWKYTFTDLPKYYDEGKEYVYNVTEVAVSGYTMSVSNNSAYNFTITNIHELELTELNVTKVWNDSDNQDGLRVPEVHVVLMDGAEEVRDTVLNAENGWKDTFTELVKYRDGKLIEYTLVEDEVDDYDTEIVFNNGVFTVTNTHVPEVVNVTVNKVWNDSDNQDGIRPEEVTLKLKADGQEYTVKVVKSTDGKWNYTFTDLPKYSNGQEIVYTVEEVNIAKGYTVSYSDDTLSIVNTHVPEVTEVNVSKVWDDAEDNDGKRPGSVTVDLLADGVVVDTAVLDEFNDWEYTFSGLDKFANGKEIVYNITESNVPEGYTVKVVFCEGEFKVVNSYIPENTTVTVAKVWDDNNDQDAVRPDSITVKLLNGETVVQTAVISGDGWTYTFTGLPKYSNGQEIVYTVEEVVPMGYISNIDGTTIVNTHVPEVTEVNVSKVWDDAEDNDGKRPDSVTVELLADGVVVDTVVLDESNGWKYTFSALDKFANGKEIVYNITESNVPEGYTVKVVFCEGVFKVVNSYIPENTSINVNKVWEDANNQDAIRPDAVFVSVLANGEEYKLVKLTSEDGWTVTVGGLPKYSNGKEIVYTVEEAGVPDGYTAVVDGLTITNTHVPEVISVNVSKVWKDNDNNDGVRPESVTVHLFADGKEVGKATLSETNGWKYTFDNLPLNSEGKPVTYTVSEDSVEGYSTSLVNCNGTFKFINTHDDSKVNIKINKVWEDNEDQDNIRPENVTVEVLANGERYDVVVINSTGGWKITVSDLPEFVGGQKVVYTVREIRVETGYTSSVDGFTITNTHEPFTKEINVTKIWNDNNSSLRPESVTVHLMDGDNVVATVSLSAGNDWKATFKDLPLNRDGKAIVYTVKEVEVPDYTTEIKDCCGNFKIVNTPIVVPINITVNKVWNDNNNNDGLRPGSVTIRLLADGEMVEVAVITGDDWTYTFTDLPEYKDGKKVTYTVEEMEVPRGYVASVDGLTITNTHRDITKNITVSKFWDDDNNNDGKRPGSVTIRLLADGNEVATATLSDDNDWKHIFEDLPVNKDGKEIVYNVTEDSVDPYAVSITNVDDEFIVTNSYNITKINLTVNKVWIDDDNNDGLRPDNITVILYANGEELVAAVVGEDNDWTYTFSDLQKYNNGYLIEYTIDELPVDGYVAVVDGLTITNTHDIITKDIPVSKVWVDNNNNDGTRPDSVTINLYAFGRKVSSISITEADGWEGVFKDLPVYIKGNEIVYTIVEESVPDYWVTYNGSMIINTHDLVNTSVTVTKVWNDSNNNDGVRPDSVSVNLYADGVKVSSIVLSSNNSWTHTFDKLPKYNDGQIINYTVDEEVVGDYSVSITEDSNYFIIVNNYETELINLTINKIWDDKDNYYGKRPVNVIVKVFADGEEIDSVVLSEENNWSCELNNLPKYDNGKLINYSVDEVNITYYHYSIEAKDNYTFTVTNTLNRVRVFKWAWKLIGWNESYYERVEVDDNVPVVKRSSKVYAKGKGIGKYQPRYRAPYRNKNHISKGKHYINRLMFREHYRLFIYLYSQYLYGNMTYSEFVALLQLNGIQIDESNAWDSNGTLIFDYDDLEDVPDSVGLHDNGGHVKDSSDRVEKYKPISNSGVIDSGEVEAEVFDVEE